MMLNGALDMLELVEEILAHRFQLFEQRHLYLDHRLLVIADARMRFFAAFGERGIDDRFFGDCMARQQYAQQLRRRGTRRGVGCGLDVGKSVFQVHMVLQDLVEPIAGHGGLSCFGARLQPSLFALRRRNGGDETVDDGNGQVS
ncbi:hypothetical protein K9B33_13200 [Sphingobium sp. 3R8]|nr:hypothetical protein [Sphingobium sp. 3R8]MBZ9648504.1 hypothetical protein [Sphingobium sp. 3R8]